VRLDQQVKKRETDAGYVLRSNCFSAELKKIELEQTLLDLGVKICYEAIVCSVLMLNENTVAGICWHDWYGEHSAACDYVIDASGDAQAVFLAGGKFRFGRESDGLPQTYTLNYSCYANGTQNINRGDEGYVNQCNSAEMTSELLHQYVLLWEDFSREKRIDFFPDLLCVREGRRIEGDENLTLDDVIHDRLSTEPIFWERSNWDTHTMDLGFEDDTAMQWGVVAMQWGTVLNIPIPRGVLIPRGLHGILVAGRCLAVDHDLAQAVRMKDSMQASGEAAAILASLAVRRKCDVRQIPYSEFLKEVEWNSIQYDNSDILLHDEMEILTGLRSDSPGRAIWSACRSGKTEYLKALLTEPIPVCANAAFALALLKDRSALPVLRDLAESDCAYRAQTPRKEAHRQEYGAIAVYLLGWLDDVRSIDLLLRKMHEHRSAAYVVNAWNALQRIGNRFPECRLEIVPAVESFAKMTEPPLEIYCFGSRRPLNILNRLRKQIAQCLNHWNWNHSRAIP